MALTLIITVSVTILVTLGDTLFCLPPCPLIHHLPFHPLPPTRSGAEIVVEEFLDGEEASFFALIDGEAAVPLASSHLLSLLYSHPRTLLCLSHFCRLNRC